MFLKRFFNKVKENSELDKWIKENPTQRVCPTCLSNCGQCGGDSHFVTREELKEHPDYKLGFTGLISNILNK